VETNFVQYVNAEGALGGIGAQVAILLPLITGLGGGILGAMVLWAIAKRLIRMVK